MLVAVEEQVHIQQPSVVKSKNATTKGAKLPEGPHLRRFSLDEFQQLVKLGFFDEDERIELLDGLVVEMSPINPRHAVCVDKLGGLINHLIVSKSMDSGSGANYTGGICFPTAARSHSCTIAAGSL